MQKLLNQDEIDAMFRAAGETSTASGVAGDESPTVLSCNFRNAGQIGADQVRAISGLHEIFARNLTHALGAYLRVAFECNLVSVEQLTYREVLARVPDVTYVATFHCNPANTSALLNIDLQLAFPIIDLLLGGQGAQEKQIRDVTDIEEQILESVVRIICHELETAWQPLGLSFAFDQRQQPAQMQRLLPPSEMTLALSFEITISELRGTLNLAFPGVVANALLRKLSKDCAYQRPRGPAELGQRLQRRVSQCEFPVELCLSGIPLAAHEVFSLKPGKVLVFPRRADAPVVLLVAGECMFTASPVRNGSMRAAQVSDSIPSTQKVAGS